MAVAAGAAGRTTARRDRFHRRAAAVGVHDAGPSKAPALRRLAQSGAFAEGVVGVTPTVTYPSHTTIVTGVLPAVHGIYNNRIFDPENTSNGSWYWYARDIKVPTLAGILKTRGMKTAAVSWPATVGADIDYLVPNSAAWQPTRNGSS